MIDLEYAKASSYLDGQEAKAREMAKAMLADDLPIEKISAYSGLSKETVLALREWPAIATITAQQVFSCIPRTRLRIPSTQKRLQTNEKTAIFNIKSKISYSLLLHA